MQSYKLTHTLPGYNKNLNACSCGYQEHVLKDNYSFECPNCESQFDFTINFSNMSFGAVPFEKQFVKIYPANNKLYTFNVDIFLIKNAYKMNFSTKKITLLNEKYKDYSIHQYRIHFDGQVYNKPSTTFENLLEPDKEYDIKSFKKEIDEISDLYSYGYEYRTIKNLTTNFNVEFSQNLKNISSVINVIIQELKCLEPWCKKREKIIKIGVDPKLLSGNVCLDKNTLNEMLNLSNYSIKVLRENEGNHLQALQIIESNFKEQSVNYINTFAKINNFSLTHIHQISDLINKANLSISKLYKYLYKDAPMKQGLYNPNETLTLLHDSFNLSKDLELPFDKKPKALVRYHNILVREYDVVADDIKSSKISKIRDENKDMEYYPKENNSENKKQQFFIRLPKDSQEIIQEGKQMRHCVASYIDNVIQNKCLIFFLRDVDSPNKSYCTIELDPLTKTIKQVKGLANTKISNKEAINTIKKWSSKQNLIYNACNW